MTRPLSGKVALVTGGGSGLGREIALELALQGAAVVVASDVPERDEAVVAECRAAGGVALAAPTDVCSEQEVKALIETCLTRYGRLDVLVTAAGIDVRETPTREDRYIRNVGLELWQRVLHVNLTGTFLCIREAIAPMAAGGGGSIITFTSGTVSRPLPGIGAYVSSKAAIEGLTRVLALEVAADGIRANILQPGGPTDTPFFPGWMDVDERAAMHEPRVIRAAAAYLAGDESRELTGASVVATEWNREHGVQLCGCAACA